MKPNATTFDPTSWLEKRRIEKKIQPEASNLTSTIAQLTQTLNVSPKTYSPLFEKFEQFFDQLVLQQLNHPEALLKLNPTRRKDLARFLAELSRIPEPEDPQEALKNFVRIDRSQAQHEALGQLFKQIAFVQIAKALLLKSWSVTLKQPLLRADLKDLTSGVEKGLRPFVNLQTSTCQLIQRNFFSWYKLDEPSQVVLWDLLEEVENLEEAKHWMLSRAIQLSAETLGERHRYSRVFYKNLWQSIEKHALIEFKFKSHYGFSPTLRDGSLIEDSPKKIEWIGFEPLSFELLFCEIRCLWKQPGTPSLWLNGSGLEMSMEQQTSMLLTHSGKQNTLQQMDSISACEIALIAEESLIRTQSRSLAAQALRKQVDDHSILKKLKQPTTTRGMYQACQALEKLRQGGLLIWAREELLDETSGKPALHFILNQAKILVIADLTTLACESEELKSDLPKALYLLKKENNLESRKGHRPLMIKAYGSLKNANDVSLLFDRIVSLVQKTDQVFPLEPFQLHARVSPIDQREWEQHWFNPTDDQFVDRIEDLKRNSTPLGQLAVVRTVHPSMELQNKWEPELFHSDMTRTPEGTPAGFYLWVESSKNGNEIYTCLPDQLPPYMKNSHTLFWVAPLQSRWNISLQIFIRSQLTRDWFNYSIERKKGAWILRESDLRSIPLPKHLSQYLMDMGELPDHLHTDHSLIGLIPTEPGQAMRAMEALTEEENHLKIKARAFVVASEVLHQAEVQQNMLFSMISPEEQIVFPKFFKTVLADQDLTGLNQHPLIRFTPTLSPNMAIHQISQVKFPTPGIILTTSKGLSQQLFIQDSWLRERCWEMIQDLKLQIAEPTWGELCQQIRLPKNPTQTQVMSQQIIKAYSQEKMKRKELNHLIGACLLNVPASQSKVGLLQ